ncbi:MAG: outer membrane beta-barrel protein [Bacteroidota bacterium]
MRFYILFFTLLFYFPLLAQTFSIKGTVVDQKRTEGVFNAKITILNLVDSSFVIGAIADFDGNFSFDSIEKGNYFIKVQATEFEDLFVRQNVDQNIVGLRLEMTNMVIDIGEIVIDAVAVRVEQKGDTTQYNADSYKVNPDASVEDLIGKMPGITVENGVVKSQGEQIKKVTIDGEDFFGDDVSAALKNLPADIVSKIQVFDNASDQSKFTGISDGNEVKALNIVTKPGKNKGQFGKFYAGYGYPGNLYNVGASINYFKGVRKFSFVGMSNNINQQNFSSEDILGVTAVSGGGQSGGPGRGYGREETENFMVSQQSGISTSHSAGVNYSDKWGTKAKFTGSYFFNWSKTDNSQDIERDYFVSDTSGQLYSENFTSLTTNYNHRLNLKFDFDLDSSNRLTVTPKFSMQGNDRFQSTTGLTQDNNLLFINNLAGSILNDGNGLNASNSVLWMHKFKKPRRTFSTNISGTFNDKYNFRENSSTTNYFENGTQDSTSIIDLGSNQLTNGYGVNARFSYTEPLDSVWSTELFYAPSYSVSKADKRTYDYMVISPTDGVYLDTLLSNVFDNRTIDNEIGTSFKLKKQKLDLSLGLSYKNSIILNEQTFPVGRNVDLMFNNILPSGRINYKFTKSNSFMLGYRAYTRNPTIDQLQNVVDNSNPLSVSTGNSELKQQYGHRLFGRYNLAQLEKGSVFFVQINGEAASKYISNSSLIATSDTILADGTRLAQGSQYRRPENLSGFWNARGLVTYGFPIKKLKLNLNVSAGTGYGVVPAQINNQINLSKTLNVNAGTTVSSNISEFLDFAVNYTFNYNNAVNSIQQQANNQFFVQNLTAKFNWIIKERLVINTNFTLSSYAGLSTDFNRLISLWNAAIGYKFLKEKQMEVRLSVFDILNNNNSITRNVTNIYIEDVESNVVNRYVMLTAVYNLKKFGGKKVDSPAGEQSEKR